jgi:hypothetical protein
MTESTSASKSAYAGMTVNERLYMSGNMDKWDAAVRRRDRLQMIAILGAVDLGNQADAIVDRALANSQ